MGPASWSRAVEILGVNGGCGSGTLIAPGLVLTALHVVTEADGGPPAIGRQVQVRVLRDRQVHPVDVVWVGDRDLDAVLLRGDPGQLGQDLAPVRWGELTCSSPAVQPECLAVGFPRAMRHTTVRPDGSRTVVHDNRQVVGRVSAVTGLNAAKYDVDVSNALPDHVNGKSGWSGLSGAGLFCHEILIGVVAAVSENWGGRTLWALPVRRLLALADFTTVVTAHTGIAVQLESADQSPLFHDPPVPRLSPSYLLSPQAEVVPFTGMEEEIANLTSWCTSRRVVDVAVVFGPGGVGKTRLATELVRRMTQRGSSWTAGFLSDVQRAGGLLESLTTNIRPLLLVLDYAETRVDQVEQVLHLFSGARHAHDPVRVLLLARPAQRWWTDLLMEWQGSTVMGQGTVVRLTPPAVNQRADTTRKLEIATRAFRERIAHLAALDGPLTEDDESSPAHESQYTDHPVGPPDDLVVSIHIAALAKVLDNTDVLPAADTIRPVDVLLAHESRYWRHSVRSHGLEDLFLNQRDLLRQLVAVQRIVGAEQRRDALNAVVAAFRFHDRDFDTPQLPDREITRRVEQMLADLYPSTDGARWGAMSPDVLAAELIARADQESDSELVVHILPDAALSPAQQHRALTVLARATTHQPGLTNSVARAVATAPDVLLTAAVDVAGELPPSEAVTWLTALRPTATPQTDTGGQDPTGQLQRINRLLDQLAPGSSATVLETDTQLTDTEPAPGPPTGTPEHTDATSEAADEALSTADRTADDHAQRADPPDARLSPRDAPRARVNLPIHLPAQARPEARKPVPAQFRFASGAVIDPGRQQRIDHALRCLSEEARRSDQPLPAVNTIVLGLDSSIELSLSAAAPAIAPFRSEGLDTVWRCRGDRVLPPDTETDPPPHAYPALAHLGWMPDGTIIFADLEHVRLIHLDGLAEHVQPILGALAFELTTRRHGDRPHVHITGVPAHLYDPGSPTPHNTLEEALAATHAHTAQARSTLQALGLEHPRDARLRDPSNDLWRPRIILSGHQPTTDTATELGNALDAHPQACLGVVARAPSPGRGRVAKWTVTLDGSTTTS
ncbi:serine protease [Kitasatospora sp. NPDC004669]|uniref:serine protease n=1 Tax=Kitasatospora sp. NPDC004669 TaxID=3154555 RepID=UPI0033B80995